MSLKEWFRYTIGRAPLPIQEAAALSIARAECMKRAWEFEEQVMIRRSGLCYLITTAAHRIGGNVRMTVDGRSGAIRSAERSLK